MKTKLITAAVLTVLSLSVSEVASAEVFKCLVDGKTVYQQSPCAGQVDTAEPMKINMKDTGANGDAEIGYVKVGMSREEVIKKWGSPTKINDSFVAGHKHEQWVYDRGNFKSQYLYLEDGILTSWQNSN